MAKFKTRDEMVAIRAQLRETGRKLVFTNGCFDILHAGHVRYLNEARSQGDALVVAVNSDRSVAQIKGPGRPVVPDFERAEILAALSCVDYVVIFDESTPAAIIEQLTPDVLVKGADWKLSEIVGRETVERAGGVVRNIELAQGHSTTSILRRVIERFGKEKSTDP